MNDATGFTAFVPGFDFIKNLGQQASAASPSAAMPGMAWVAPTFDVEELDKRIKELKSMQFWLEQNARALSATIQALEVQKMTLSTLKNMDVGMDEVAKAMQVNPADLWSAWQTGGAQATATAQAQPMPDNPADEADTTAAANHPASDKAKETVDPTQWWASVSQQFQDIAANAMQDISKAAAQANAMAQATSKPAKATTKKPAAKKTAAKKAPVKRPAAKRPSAKTAAGKRRA